MRNPKTYVIVVAIAAGAAIAANNDPTFNPPTLSDAPEDIRSVVQRGHNTLHETHKYASNHVGNKLDCTNCHFDAGSR